MNHDPIEDTKKYKNIESEVEYKVRRSFLDEQIRALEDIIENGFRSYWQESAAFRGGRIPEYTEDFEEIPPSPEESLEMQERSRRRLNEIRGFLQAGQTDDAYDRFIVKGFGFCHKFWNTKKCILKKEYGIEWKTPAEMNPMVRFD